MRRKVILFTDSYPYGWAETFVALELEHLCRTFDRVTVVPLRYGGVRRARPLPDNAGIVGPILRGDSRSSLLAQGLLARAPLAP